MTRAGVESQDCLCLRRGWQTDMYLSTVRDTVMYTDITRLVCTLRFTNHNAAQRRNELILCFSSFQEGTKNVI